MPAQPVGGSGHRIDPSGQLHVEITSNFATTFYATCRVVYDDGEEDVLTVPDTISGSARATQGFDSQNHAKRHGWVYDAVITTRPVAVPTQRGQCFGRMTIGPSAGGVLGYGYLYSGHDISQGQYDEPGPAGGHGARMRFTGANPAAGVLCTDSPPTAVIWRLRSYEAVLVTDATVGNRGFALVVDDGSGTGRIFAVNNPNTQAATLTRTWAWFIGNDASATVGATFTDTQVVLPSYTLKSDLFLGTTIGGGGAVDVIRLVSTGALAFTATDDFAAAIIEVEEWVMPN